MGGLTKMNPSKHMSSIDLSSLAKQEEALQPRRARLPRRSSMKKLTEVENDSSDQPARFDKPQRRLGVGFSSCPIENSVEYTLHHKDMTNEEKMNVWMQTDCTTKIQKHFGMSCADSIASAYKTVGKSDESQTRA